MWDIPYREVLWNQAALSWLVEGVFGIPWSHYVGSAESGFAIEAMTRILGGILIFCAIVAALSSRLPRRWGAALYVGAGIVSTVAVMTFLERTFEFAMLMEFAAQISAPILLYSLIHGRMSPDRLAFWMKAAIALTFAGHGFYALGIYPVPAQFIDMIIGVLGTNETQARALLQFAGAMDLIIAVAIFVPSLQTPALTYAVVWGLLTTSARPLAHIDAGSGFESVIYWMAQALYRFPHAGLPLCILIASHAHFKLIYTNGTRA